MLQPSSRVGVLAALALVLCTAFPLAVAAARPTASTGSPVQAVSTLVRPFTHTLVPPGCNAVSGQLASCPITQRLRKQIQRELRWERTHTMGGNGNVICRCQNTPRFITVKLLNNNGRTAHVTTLWGFGAPYRYSLVFAVVHRQGKWLVDDSYCAGRPGTSMYHIPIKGCSLG